MLAGGLRPLRFFPFQAVGYPPGDPLGSLLAAVAVGRPPRYLLLAWLGLTGHVPAWLLGLLFVVLVIPSLRELPWPTRNAN